MKILMLSWEYPPNNIGGLSKHVYNLSQELSKLKHEVHVITCEEGTSPLYEKDNGVWVHRVASYNIDTTDFAKWVMHLNFAMIEEATRLIREVGRFDIIHAHDWLTTYTAKALKWSFSSPLVCTMHATEQGRNNGIKTEMQRYISNAEWLLTYESCKTIVCNENMKNEVVELFKTPAENIWIIPNGIGTEKFNIPFDEEAFRSKYASSEEKIILFLGKHSYQKGIHLLIEAIPEVISAYSKVKFLIVGKGPMTEELQDRISCMNLEHKVIFTGYLGEEEKIKLYRVSDIAVVPSMYEHFGTTALEAMAANCAVLASDIGGLSEIVEHKQNGLKFICGVRESLRDNLLELLNDDNLIEKLKKSGKKEVDKRYSWYNTAKITEQLYKTVISEVEGSPWASWPEEEEKKKLQEKLKKEKEKAAELKKQLRELQAAKPDKVKEAEASKVSKTEKAKKATKTPRKKQIAAKGIVKEEAEKIINT
ncbi:glycosyltransferase family 4 protein [Clostridium peptidivorans]|uniref:glycosyltransferase family 4 protein n=1 Tax=Clostridium peptidivorans TaxID=100174 RepID=UPI000BE43E00|nr:glycosyltransferase family 4 protein [Clostridium peptidivorans]